MDERALEAVRTWVFEPARLNGAPVAVRTLLEVDFRSVLRNRDRLCLRNDSRKCMTNVQDSNQWWVEHVRFISDREMTRPVFASAPFPHVCATNGGMVTVAFETDERGS